MVCFGVLWVGFFVFLQGLGVFLQFFFWLVCCFGFFCIFVVFRFRGSCLVFFCFCCWLLLVLVVFLVVVFLVFFFGRFCFCLLFVVFWVFL